MVVGPDGVVPRVLSRGVCVGTLPLRNWLGRRAEPVETRRQRRDPAGRDGGLTELPSRERVVEVGHGHSSWRAEKHVAVVPTGRDRAGVKRLNRDGRTSGEMYDDILLPVDGSDETAATVSHVAELADWADATVHVLYVADTARDSVTVVDGQVVDALVREGDRAVESVAETLASRSVDHQTEVLQGDPAPTIVDYAAERADLIVTATRGREGLSRLAGSVSERVVRLSSVPVVTTRRQSDETLVFPYEDVLVPTDGSEAARVAADHVCSLAATLDATVHALSVVDDATLGLDIRETTGADDEQTARAAVESVVSVAGANGVTDTVEAVERGTPADAIADYVDANGVDAVGMGTTGRRGTERILLGSVSEATVRTAPVPVLTVGDGA